MPRTIRLAGAEMGANALKDTRAQLAVFPEVAFTTFLKLREKWGRLVFSSHSWT
jgi:hypothetical protein